MMVSLCPQDRIHINAGKLMLSKVNLEDSGMYQCLAENKHSVIYASAELKVVGEWPTFFLSKHQEEAEYTLTLCHMIKC